MLGEMCNLTNRPYLQKCTLKIKSLNKSKQINTQPEFRSSELISAKVSQSNGGHSLVL